MANSESVRLLFLMSTCNPDQQHGQRTTSKTSNDTTARGFAEGTLRISDHPSQHINDTRQPGIYAANRVLKVGWVGGSGVVGNTDFTGERSTQMPPRYYSRPGRRCLHSPLGGPAPSQFVATFRFIRIFCPARPKSTQLVGVFQGNRLGGSAHVFRPHRLGHRCEAPPPIIAPNDQWNHPITLKCKNLDR